MTCVYYVYTNVCALVIIFFNMCAPVIILFNIGKIKGCSKSIYLRNFLKTFLWGKKKQLIFFTAFYVFCESGIKIFLK